MHKFNMKIPFSKQLVILYQVCEAMSYLHRWADVIYVQMKTCMQTCMHASCNTSFALQCVCDIVRDDLDSAVSLCTQSFSIRIVHRDLKSSNVIYQEAAGISKLCDFGLARLMPPGVQELDPSHLGCQICFYGGDNFCVEITKTTCHVCGICSSNENTDSLFSNNITSLCNAYFGSLCLAGLLKSVYDSIAHVYVGQHRYWRHTGVPRTRSAQASSNRLPRGPLRLCHYDLVFLHVFVHLTGEEKKRKSVCMHTHYRILS